MNTVAYFEVQAAQPDSLIAFYREVFGWQFTRAEGLPIPYWAIDTGGDSRWPPPTSSKASSARVWDQRLRLFHGSFRH
jgi:hypothetical protein